MVSSFDKVINRRNTDSLKWDGMKERFGPIPDDTLPMWVADMDFLSPEPVIKALHERVEHGVFGYASDPLSLFEAVAEWMKRVHGWNVDPGSIFTAPGVMPAIGMAVRALTRPGEKVIIMPPVYPPFSGSWKTTEGYSCRFRSSKKRDITVWTSKNLSGLAGIKP
jgi:cystathionine beta-lyase